MPQRIRKSHLPDDIKKVNINVGDLKMVHKPSRRKKSTSIHEYKNNDSEKETRLPRVEEMATATYEEGIGPPIDDDGAVAVTNPEAT